MEAASRPSAIRVGLQTAARAAVVAAVGTRFMAPALLGRGRRDRARVAAAACRASHALGSTFLKFGQVVASSPGLVGVEVSDAFRSCLDTGPPIEERELLRAIERAAGCRVSEAYREIDPVPIGKASIAVVHRAITAAGEPVAIKVRRPGVSTIVDSDIRILRGLTLAAMRITKSADAAQMLDVIDDFERNIHAELDFTKERQAIERIGARLEAHGFDRIAAPKTHPELSDEGVLVMELFDGVAIDDLAGIARLGVDPGPLVDDVIRAWLVTSLVDGDFHGDCHAGNVLVLRDGRLGLIDWGIIGQLDEAGRLCTVRMLEGGLGDQEAWSYVADYFLSILGQSLLTEIGATREELPNILRDLLGPMLTAPFGRTSLSEFLTKAKDRSQAAANAAGSETLSATRDHAQAEARTFVQGFFLWMKQLVFFERYARIHRRTLSVAGHAAKVLPIVPGAKPRAARSVGRDVDFLHHVSLVVNDLGRGIECYRRLGFAPSRPSVPAVSRDDGTLRPFGAANAYVHFPRNFLELVTCVRDGAPVPADAKLVPLQVRREHMERFLEIVGRSIDELASCLSRFEGMHRLVFHTPDAYAAAERLSSLTIGHSGVNVTERPVDTDGGPRTERLRFMELDRTDLPEGTMAVAESLQVKRPTAHPNGALDLVETILAVPDAELGEFARRYEAYVGRPPRADGATRVFDLERARVVIVAASALGTLLPGERAAALPAYVAHAYTVEDVEATRRLLERNEVPVARTPTGELFVPGRAAMGAAVIFRPVRG